MADVSLRQVRSANVISSPPAGANLTSVIPFQARMTVRRDAQTRALSSGVER